MEEVAGFTEKQRRWFIDVRAKGQCEFYSFNGKTWVRCKNREHLEVHHIVPRFWAKTHLPHTFQLNAPENGIVLCGGDFGHHCGKEGVHVDAYEARRSYRNGNHNAFAELRELRNKKCMRGLAYWDTKWDMIFLMIVKKATSRVEKSYPTNARRGLTGRIPVTAP